jgi:hypothetical protein
MELLKQPVESFCGYDPAKQVFFIGSLEAFFHDPDKIKTIHVSESELFETLKNLIFNSDGYLKIDNVIFPL